MNHYESCGRCHKHPCSCLFDEIKEGFEHLRKEREGKMKRHILFSYNDNDGPKMKSYVDDTAAVKDWMEMVFENQDGFEEFLALFRYDGHIEDTHVIYSDVGSDSYAEPAVICLYTTEVY